MCLSDYLVETIGPSSESRVGADYASLNECIHIPSGSKHRAVRADTVGFRKCRTCLLSFLRKIESFKCKSCSNA
jgi:hypothetical protein